MRRGRKNSGNRSDIASKNSAVADARQRLPERGNEPVHVELPPEIPLEPQAQESAAAVSDTSEKPAFASVASLAAQQTHPEAVHHASETPIIDLAAKKAHEASESDVPVEIVEQVRDESPLVAPETEMPPEPLPEPDHSAEMPAIHEPVREVQDGGDRADVAAKPESASAPLSHDPFTPFRENELPPPPPPPFLFEVAWEVCWQLGGIYTVLKSKVEQMLRKWSQRYFLIGPYNPATAAVEFEEQAADGIIGQALDRLRAQGVQCHYGRWLVAGRPRVILIDAKSRFHRLDTDKFLLWQDHGIGTAQGDAEVNEVISFGFGVAEFFRHLTSVSGDRPIIGHFHEWMAGVAVPRIAHERIKVLTVFTTHATLLGRYLASDSAQFYSHLPFLNGDVEAKKYMIYPRFQIERAAAHASTVFTTVSEVTGFEAEKLLGRKPDMILPNGLNIERFAALHEFQNLHLQYKEKIHEFVMGHFFPCYTFDLDNTLYFFTSGRYEYRNKGMDVFIEALFRLNQRLKWMAERPTIVAFIITKAPTRHINVGVLQNQSMFEELKSWCETLQENMGARLFYSAAHGRLPTLNDLVDEDERVRLKQGIYAWRTGRQPPIITHDLVDDATDPVLQHLRYRGLFNAGDDPVKVVFHPQFVSATSPLISLDYDQFVRGCHMGIFPSYYEPWGYTPMESIALGVPAVTTDLAGFGAYVREEMPGHEDQGIHVIDRRYRGFEEAVENLVEHLIKFTMLTRRQRIELRNKVERMGERFDWSALISHYNQAHELALTRGGVSNIAGKVDIRMV